MNRTLPALRRFRIALLFFVILQCRSIPCMAYEEDTHFLMTYVMLKSVGYSHTEALFVAAVDHGMDDFKGVVANGGILGIDIIPNVPEESLWHALDKWGSIVPIRLMLGEIKVLGNIPIYGVGDPALSYALYKSAQ